MCRIWIVRFRLKPIGLEQVSDEDDNEDDKLVSCNRINETSSKWREWDKKRTSDPIDFSPTKEDLAIQWRKEMKENNISSSSSHKIKHHTSSKPIETISNNTKENFPFFSPEIWQLKKSPILFDEKIKMDNRNWLLFLYRVLCLCVTHRLDDSEVSVEIYLWHAR